MANQKFPLGRNARLYYNTNNTLITAAGSTVQISDITTWLALPETVAGQQIRNMTQTLDDNMVDTNTRETTEGGFMSETPVLHQASFTFDTPWDLNASLISQMIAAWSGFSRMAFAVLNRDKDSLVSGDIVNGFAGNCWCAMSKDENPDDVQRGNWTIRHADSGIWYEVVTP